MLVIVFVSEFGRITTLMISVTLMNEMEEMYLIGLISTHTGYPKNPQENLLHFSSDITDFSQAFRFYM